jgi:hypothetical protein
VGRGHRADFTQSEFLDQPVLQRQGDTHGAACAQRVAQGVKPGISNEPEGGAAEFLDLFMLRYLDVPGIRWD